VNELVRLRGILRGNNAATDVLRVATVNVAREDGTSLVTDDSGNQFVAVGATVSPGYRAMIEGRTIVAQVPALPTASFYV
jgi:hypothetical protein